MTDTQTIPLNKLVVCERNVRKTGAEDDLGELIASIEAHGLLQSLVVRQAPRGKFAVMAGGRRLRALQALAQARKVKASMPVKCTVVADDANTVEISLAENVIRAPMHPADQFEAFKAVIDEGNATVVDVAARFGITEAVVAKRLKLGRLAPSILAAYRAGEIDLEEAQAFTLSDDHAEQERVFNELQGYARNARNIRHALTQSEVPVTDRRVQFVGLEAYEAAGGAIRRDLFADRDHAYLQDAVLLDRLVADKLNSAGDAIRTEGWKWVEVAADADYSVLSGFTRLYPERGRLSAKSRKELDKLSKRYDRLAETADESDEAAMERLQAIEQRIDEIKASAEKWPAKTLAKTGVIVTLSHDGSLAVHRGLIHPDDVRKTKKTAKSAKPQSGDSPAVGLSAALVLELTAQKTAAIQAELATRPDVALASTVHALVLSVLCQGAGGNSLHLRGVVASTEGVIAQKGQPKALDELSKHRAAWLDRLPDMDDMWTWCLAQPTETLLSLLAFLVACTVDGMQHPHPRPEDAQRPAHADAIANALKLDMRSWYTPTAENYFSRISRDSMIAVFEEAKGVPVAPALTKLKKAELAIRVQQAIEGTGWLPAILRTSSSHSPDDAAQAAE